MDVGDIELFFVRGDSEEIEKCAKEIVEEGLSEFIGAKKVCGDIYLVVAIEYSEFDEIVEVFEAKGIEVITFDRCDIEVEG